MYQDVLRSCRFLFVLLFAFIISCGGGGGGDSSSSSGPIVLSAPGSINATDGAYNDRVVINWSEVTNAKNYKIYRCETLDGEYQSLDTISTTSFSDDTVVYRTDYYYKVSTISSDDTEGDLSNPESGYADDMPSGITGLDAKNGDETDQVAVTWNSDGNSDSYEVYRKTSSGVDSFTLIGEPTSASYNDTTVTPGTLYDYKVRGKTSYGTLGPESGSDTGYANLAAPLSITVTEGDHLDGIAIDWDVVSHAAEYRIRRSTSESGTYNEIATVTATEYTDTSTEVLTNPGKNYYYKIAGVSSEPLVGNECSAVCGYVGVEVPSNVQATDGTYYTKILVSWTGVSGASNYRVYRSVDSGEFSQVNETSSTDYTDTSVSSGSSYTYKITAVTDNESGESVPATGSVKDSAVDTDLTFSWDPNREKSVNRSNGGYRVYYSNTQGFDIGSADRTKDVAYVSGSTSPTSTTLTFSSADAGTWYLRIVAYGQINGTEYTNNPSDEISITIE